MNRQNSFVLTSAVAAAAGAVYLVRSHSSRRSFKSQDTDLSAELKKSVEAERNEDASDNTSTNTSVLSVSYDVSDSEEEVVARSFINEHPNTDIIFDPDTIAKTLEIDQSLFGEGLKVIKSTDIDGAAIDLVQFQGKIGEVSRSIRTSEPIKASYKDGLVSYYEVKIVEAPEDVSSKKEEKDSSTKWSEACISIGLATKNYPMNDSMPGWKPNSFGYHSDDGSTFGNCVRQASYGPTFGVGDVVGCGLDYETRTLFYTLNGKFLDVAATLDEKMLTEEDWYPTIGLDSHDGVECNFGGQPFVFDLQNYCEIMTSC
mmetsp:Transcript_28567/g.53740  ORF Transcript_28567/g.53740 Transcript_28567/m.53740 type:complete len:315 (-) Transcript_28567:167-1111(-)|eukprot:CAMPEP_0178748160 /NCGR_PEP_ID=MMETSP0744-20121128/8737_1 /TAXON_ID=913974 /ORGANISM="Nitzschia punctata, Strain CCMP561" /LENGTH=314 /DNA_ID=CAMNT_0020401505 /DNA_START=1249 /DNA_END=2193 /DNA_ORIENTATION=-